MLDLKMKKEYIKITIENEIRRRLIIIKKVVMKMKVKEVDLVFISSLKNELLLYLVLQEIILIIE